MTVFLWSITDFPIVILCLCFGTKVCSNFMLPYEVKTAMISLHSTIYHLDLIKLLLSSTRDPIT